MKTIHIIKHSRKNFYCRECREEYFKLIGAKTNDKKLNLILRCVACETINVLPVYAVREIEIENEKLGYM